MTSMNEYQNPVYRFTVEGGEIFMSCWTDMTKTTQLWAARLSARDARGIAEALIRKAEIIDPPVVEEVVVDAEIACGSAITVGDLDVECVLSDEHEGWHVGAEGSRWPEPCDDYHQLKGPCGLELGHADRHRSTKGTWEIE